MSDQKYTLEYQIGFYVGQNIYRSVLPTLDVSPFRSNVVYEVSEEEKKEFQELEKQHFKYRRDEDWERLRKSYNQLKEKYLPHKIRWQLPIFDVENIEEFKQGVRDALWDTDICEYKIETDADIKIVEPDDGFSHCIELTLDVS